jgi:DNA-binding MarR family transcriptional regulator
MSDSSRITQAGGEQPTPGVYVRQGVAMVSRWITRSEVRRYVFGPAAAELSPTDSALLEYLDRNGPLRLSDLAAQAGVSKSTMTPQVRRLEDKGLIDRQADPSDGRSTLVGISAKGSELQRRIGVAGAAAFDEILSTWSQQDRQVLGSLLLRFAQQLSHYGPTGTGEGGLAGTGTPSCPAEGTDHDG